MKSRAAFPNEIPPGARGEPEAIRIPVPESPKPRLGYRLTPGIKNREVRLVILEPLTVHGSPVGGEIPVRRQPGSPWSGEAEETHIAPRAMALEDKKRRNLRPVTRVELPEHFLKEEVPLPPGIEKRSPGLSVVAVVAEDTGFGIEIVGPGELTHRGVKDDISDPLRPLVIDLTEASEIWASRNELRDHLSREIRVRPGLINTVNEKIALFKRFIGNFHAGPLRTSGPYSLVKQAARPCRGRKGG